MTKSRWEIAESAANWECGWEDSRRFQLRYFRALSITDKLKAVEEMAELVEFFSKRVQERRKRSST
jgi:hypothetical protein